MSEPFKIVIGLEVHVQLLTKTKLFCGCLNKFGLPPNSATCPVCLGLPGSLPVMNRRRSAWPSGRRWRSTAPSPVTPAEDRFTKWDRKNYYYPDLPKNYQISQYDLPFSHDGWLEINVAKDAKKEYAGKKVGIIRAHLEEDAGKILHDESGRGGDSRVDLNRTGTPLLEIVCKPDMNSPEEAMAYLEEIRLLLREIGVSDCEMQEGCLRCDANVNIHIPQADGVAPSRRRSSRSRTSTASAASAGPSTTRRSGTTRSTRRTRTNFRFGKLLKTTAGLGRCAGRHRRPAPQGRGRGLPLLPRAGPRAGRGVAGVDRRSEGRDRRTARRAAHAPADAVRPLRLRCRRADREGPADGRVLRGGCEGCSATARPPRTA